MGEEREWTEAGLRSIRATGRREQFWDPKTPGLVLLMTPSGAKTFYLAYRAGGGRVGKRRWFKIGRFGLDVSLAAARAQALKRRGEIAEGKDPQAERKAARAPQTTVADLCDRFERDYLSTGRVAASTAVSYRYFMDARIRPGIGGQPVATLGTAAVAAFLRELPAGMARKVRATLSRMFTMAELWELRAPGTNPVKGQDLEAAVPRRVRLTDAQVKALGKALAGPETVWQARALFVLLALTGMRVSELAGNRKLEIPARPWTDLDLRAGVLWLPRHKTVKKIGPRPVYLCAAARQLLESMPRDGDLILGGWANVSGAWARLRVAAGLKGINPHDLRHTFSSVGDDLGFSEATCGALLGHAAATQTARYTHKLSKDLAAAAEAIGGRMAALLGLSSPPVVER